MTVTLFSMGMDRGYQGSVSEHRVRARFKVVTWGCPNKTHRVQVPNNQVLGFWVVVIIVQVFGKYKFLGTWTLREILVLVGLAAGT